jgi:hypothetical protein
MPDVVAPAPVVESAPVTNTMPGQSEGVMGVADLFSQAEQFFSAPQDNDSSPSVDMHDLVNSINSPIGNDVAKQQENDVKGVKELGSNTDSDDEDLPLYQFEGLVGEKNIVLDIQDKAQLDKMISKAIAAQDLYKEHKKMSAELSTYKEKAELLDQIDQLTEKDPIKFMDNLVEDLTEEQEEKFADWLLVQADNLRKSKVDRERDRILRDAQRIRQEKQMDIQRHERLMQQQEEVRLKSEQQQLSSWANSEFSKYSAKLPAEYKGWVDEQIKYVVAKSRQIMDNGDDVTFEDLSRMLHTQIKPVLGRATPNQVRQEIGKATDAKRQQSLSKLQSSAGRVVQPSARNNRLQELTKSGDTAGMFDFFGDMVENGSLKLSR